MIESLTQEETIAKAKECYALGLISEPKMLKVCEYAERNPGYNPICDLPFDWEVEHERDLRRKAARREQPWWRRLLP